MLEGDKLKIAILEKQKKTLTKKLSDECDQNMGMVWLNCRKALFLTWLYEQIEGVGQLTIKSGDENHIKIKEIADQVDIDT